MDQIGIVKIERSLLNFDNEKNAKFPSHCITEHYLLTEKEYNKLVDFLIDLKSAYRREI